MSGEPKTLTPEEGTLAGLIATLGIHGYSLTFQEGRWWAVPPQDTPYEWCEGDTPGEAASKALGVPVVARDEAAELRAALDAARDAMVSALAYHHHSLSNPVKEELNAAINRAGRALAGGESQR